MTEYPLFHNTTDLSGDKLREALTSATTLMSMIQRFYEVRPCHGYSPGEVRAALINAGITREDGYPITSYRACITKLQKDGVLLKTKDWTRTEHGHRAHRWKLNVADSGQMGLDL